MSKNYVVTVSVVGSDFHVRFPLLEGMREWATDELGAAYISDPKGWRYVLPATHERGLHLSRSCPLPIRYADERAHMLCEGAQEDLFLPDIPQGVLEQPHVRVFEAWRHQLIAYHYLLGEGMVGMLNMKMGTGKTKVLIDAAVNTGVHLGLILCPPKVLGVWRREMRTHAPHARVLVLDDSYASVRKKQEAAEAFVVASRFTQNQGRMFIVAINYESARMMAFSGWACKQKWDLVALDESHRCKDPSGVTAKLIERLRLVSKRRVCLTGTPMPHSPADIFTQYRFIDPSVFGGSFFAFKKRYAITGYFKEVVGWRHKEELRQKFHSKCVTIGEEVLDLPPLQMVDRTFRLDAASLRIYRELWIEFVAATERGVVAIDNALVKLVRAQQVTSGFVVAQDESGAEVIEHLGQAKRDELEDVLRDAGPGEKVVVFCRWKYDLAQVRSVVESLEWELNGVKAGNVKRRQELIDAGSWQHYRCGEISGSRCDLTKDAKLSPDFEVFAVQVQSGGVGVDFTDSALAVLYSIDFSLGNYEQMLKRLHRPGQKRSVRIVRLIAEKTVDAQIYQALSDRRQVVESIVEFAKEAGGIEDAAESA